MKGSNKKIAIVIQNFIQYYAARKFIDNFSDAEIHIFVPQGWWDSGFDEIFDNIYSFLNLRYKNVYRANNGQEYQILLEPYYIDREISEVKAKYRLKYKYSAISAKTNPSYSPNFNLNYDGILCYSNYEKDLLSIYAKTFLVGKLNYCDFAHSPGNRKTILYLPTYGATSSVLKDLRGFIKLKKEYKIVTRLHHGTIHLASEKKNPLLDSGIFDKVYNEEAPLEEILRDVDIVVSDNSGSLFEAIYAGIPVCSISARESSNHYGSLYPLQNDLRKRGVIPFRTDTSDIEGLIDEVLSDEVLKKQKEFRKEQFPLVQSEFLSSFNDAVNYYLNDNVSSGDLARIRLRNIIVRKEKERMYEEKEFLRKDNNRLKNELIKLERESEVYRNRSLYRAASKIYDLLRLIRK